MKETSRNHVNSDNTKAAFADILQMLCDKQTLPGKITVAQLVKAACIHRNTFYYHFKDIRSLMEWTVRHNFSKMIRDKAAKGHKEVDDFVLSYLSDHSKFLRYVYDSAGHDSFTDMLIDDLIFQIRVYIDEYCIDKGLKISPETKEYYLRIFSEYLLAVYLYHIRHPEYGSREKLAVALRSLYDLMLPAVLEHTDELFPRDKE